MVEATTVPCITDGGRGGEGGGGGDASGSGGGGGAGGGGAPLLSPLPSPRDQKGGADSLKCVAEVLKGVKEVQHNAEVTGWIAVAGLCKVNISTKRVSW